MAPGANLSHRLVWSTSTRARIDHARAFLLELPRHSEALIVASTRGAADDLAREAALAAGASVGWQRFSLLQIASRLALATLAGRGRLPSSPLGAEAVASRAVFDVSEAAALEYFAEVAVTPGFTRALARTLGELRLAGVSREQLASLGQPGAADLARLLDRVEEEFLDARAADRALLLATACEALDRATEASRALVAGRALVLLDPAVTCEAEARLVQSLVASSSRALATIPEGDAVTRDLLERLGVFAGEALDDDHTGDIGRLRRRIFSLERVTPDAEGGEVRLFSAPGEAREAVEISRRILDEARRGVPFDQMAVLLRAPQQYLGLVEHALARASIPAWFDRGTRRPDPSGRALLALLCCAEEGLSARRFAEYLSLAQVPDPDSEPVVAEALLPADDEVLSAGVVPGTEPGDPPDPPFRQTALAALPVVDGTLRAPWRWEELLVESAVIGGRDRWVARLGGLEQEYRTRLAELRSDEPEAPRAVALARDLEHLRHLRAFALPVVEELDAWRTAAWTWGEWLQRIGGFAPRVLRQPARVRRVLAELAPMGDVGPAGIAEIRKVLNDRLRNLAVEPPPRRFGRVFVGSPDHARGRAFRVVFVPGLAERIFPQKLREDPLLLDAARTALDAGLRGRDERATDERLQLRLALGAATERIYLWFPKLDVNESRERVPSFYALEVHRALKGRIPSLPELLASSYDPGAATLGWPAPADPMRAVDALEHDLAVLRPLFDERDRAKAAGKARYLLELNACLGRSVRERWARYARPWSEFDGLTRVTPPVQPAIASMRLGARPYSLSALQHYASCPYRFLQSAVYRLAPREDVVALQRLDPLTKGSLFHRVQAEFLGQLRAEDRLPIVHATLPAALDTLAVTLKRVADEERARLAPAIRRVWDDEIKSMQRDLARWTQMMAEDRDGWVPQWFEYAFGLSDEGRDAASRPDPVTLDGRFILRGSMDLVERHVTGALRVTDHKTGRARPDERMVVAGGEVLQPVLYSLALEAATGAMVHGGRLSFCTSVGEFKLIPVLLTDTTRRAGLEVLEIIDRGIEHGILAPLPKKGACEWCDFRPVCGPDEESRVGRKVEGRFADLETLRAMP